MTEKIIKNQSILLSQKDNLIFCSTLNNSSAYRKTLFGTNNLVVRKAGGVLITFWNNPIRVSRKWLGKWKFIAILSKIIRKLIRLIDCRIEKRQWVFTTRITICSMKKLLACRTYKLVNLLWDTKYFVQYCLRTDLK